MPDDGFRPRFFDPLSTEHLTWVICGRFEQEPAQSLRAELTSFDGPGLYAIYYEGDSVALYQPISNLKIPVYVGQAKANSATGRTAPGPRPLFDRVKEHRRSIEDGGLPVQEFSIRLLALPDVHIDLGENGLRVGYRPVWNSVLTGFGSHEQGSTTRQSGRSRWDTVHQGRSRTFGENKHDRDDLIAKTRATIADQVKSYDQLPWHRETLE